MKILKDTAIWFFSISLGVAVALLVSIFIFQPTTVDGHSMEPTLQNNNRVFISKLPRTFSYKPKYEEIVIVDARVDQPRSFKEDLLDSPLVQKLVRTKKNEDILIKRVIGKPGDRLVFKNHKVYRNGLALKENYIKEEWMLYTSEKEITVPEGHIFVLGDNRNKSRDSRQIGPIPIDHVLGVKLFD
ncbi:signal peptidase I [Hazenella coriacea]|uniref:Signal peptidase I n=1 Tax=Hazenella coriacea TaxID=1179467 RepID=A0A4R3LB81_9BACL|nr:signal peptidase I [Hazenella coriacea]TCS96445.1 signal peptidase I [Hazenella coriacea]